MGEALATPVSLFGQAVPVASGEAVEMIELLRGWSLKSVEPQADLTAEFLSQAGRAAAGDGWLPVTAMPAMVHDVLLAHGKIEEGAANGDACGWFFEDNYFDLLPGETKTMHILGQHPQGRITARAWYSPLETAVDWKQT